MRVLGVGADDGDGLGLGRLPGRHLQERGGPVHGRPRPRRHDLEVGRVVVLLVVGEPEERGEHELALHHDGHRRRDQVRAVPGYDKVHLVDVEELRVDAGDGRPLGLVVVVHELDRPAEQAPLLVDVLGPELHGDQRGLAVGGQAAGQRHAEPDLDRVGRGGRPRAPQEDRPDQQGDCSPYVSPVPRHDSPPLSRSGEPLPITARGQCQATRPPWRAWPEVRTLGPQRIGGAPWAGCSSPASAD